MEPLVTWEMKDQKEKKVYSCIRCNVYTMYQVCIVNVCISGTGMVESYLWKQTV